MTMTAPDISVDLDAPPAPPPPPRSRARAPWVVAGLALAAAVAALIIRIPPPVAATPPMEPTPAATSRAIDYSGDGYTEGPNVFRGADEAITAVVLVYEPWSDDQPTTCRLVVDGHEVVDEGSDGHAAVCVWIEPGVAITPADLSRSAT